jgi:hypothetical protein
LPSQLASAASIRRVSWPFLNSCHVGALVRLGRRVALDLDVVDAIAHPGRARRHDLVEQERAERAERRDHEHRRQDARQRQPERAHRGELAELVELTERQERAEQQRDRQHQHDPLGQLEQVQTREHHRRGAMVEEHVDLLEHVHDHEQRQQTHQRESEIRQELAQHVAVGDPHVVATTAGRGTRW